MSVGEDWLGSIGHEQSSNATCARVPCDATRRLHCARLQLRICAQPIPLPHVHDRQLHTHCHDWRSEETGSADSPTPSPPLP